LKLTRLLRRQKVIEADVMTDKETIAELQERVKLLEDLLKVMRDKRNFREPNSDWHEYCNGCHYSPYNKPPHAHECVVPRIEEALKGVK
jgi:hypothetical protein